MGQRRFDALLDSRALRAYVRARGFIPLPHHRFPRARNA